MKKYLLLGFLLTSSVVYASNQGYGPFSDGATCNAVRAKIYRQTDLSKFTVTECRSSGDIVLGDQWRFSVLSK